MLGDAGTSDGVVIAIISTVGLVLVAFVTAFPAWYAAIRTKRLHDVVGVKNGQGTMMEVAEKALSAAEKAEKAANHALGAAVEAAGFAKDHAASDDVRFRRVEVALGIPPGPPAVHDDSPN